MVFQFLPNTYVQTYFLHIEKKQTGVTLAAARYSSEDAAQVVEYIQAVIDYTVKSKPYRKAVQTLKELKNEMEIIKSREAEKKMTKTDEVEEEV